DCARKLAFFPEPGVARYLSANRLVVTMRNGETEFVSLASMEVTSGVRVEEVCSTTVSRCLSARDSRFSTG
ncbi:hypothetical protein A2U01_0088799, partial [Trifolium medium]|nr:hypothetical protein [Trifolium medium]